MKPCRVLSLVILLSLSCCRTELSFSEENIYDNVNFYSFEIKNDDSLTDLEVRRLIKKKPLSEYLNKEPTRKVIVLFLYSYPNRFKQNETVFEPLEATIIRHPTGEIEITREELKYDWNLPPPDVGLDSIPELS